MKILYITTKATYGGVQTHIAQCALYMRSKGHTVAVMAHPNDGKGLEKVLHESGIPFYPNTSLRNSFNPLSGIIAMWKIRRMSRMFNPDIVSTHSTIAGVWGRFAFFNRVPVIFTAHGWIFTEGVSFLKRFVGICTEKLLANFSSKIICVSEHDRLIALKYGISSPSTLVTVHNGVEDFSYLSISKKNRSPKIPVVFVGRLSSQKDPELLLEALAALPMVTQEKIEVFIIGDGEKRLALEEYILNNQLGSFVNLLGEKDRVDLLESLGYYATAESGAIFALVSHYEGFPRSTLEAMMFGYAILTSDVGGASEAIDDKSGVVISPNKKDSLVMALEDFIEKRDIRMMGKNAQARVREHFTLEKMLLKTKAIYDEVVLLRANTR